MQFFRKITSAKVFWKPSLIGRGYFRASVHYSTPYKAVTYAKRMYSENIENEDVAVGGFDIDENDSLLDEEHIMENGEKKSFAIEIERLKYITELYSVYRISFFTSLGIVTIIVMLVVIFRRYLSQKLSKEVAAIGSKTLDEESLKISANALSRKLISEILSDEEITNLSLEFMQNLVKHEDVRNSVLEILQNLLSDEDIRNQCEKILVNTWSKITDDPTALDHASNFFGRIFNSNEVKTSVEKLFITIFNEESMKNETAKFYSDVLEQSVFRDRFFSLTQNTLNKVIIQEYTQENAKKFICRILEDEEMKAEASQFLFDAAKLMITPKWFQSAPSEKKGNVVPAEEEGEGEGGEESTDEVIENLGEKEMKLKQ